MRIHKPRRHRTTAMVVALAYASAAGAAIASDYTITDLGTLGDASYATGLNESAQVVGWYVTTWPDQSAFLWENGSMTDLGNLGSTTQTWSNAINNSGVAVGFSYDSTGVPHAFQWTSTNGMIDLTPNESFARANGINNAGQVVGLAGSHAFLWSDVGTGGLMVDLGTLGGWHSEAFGINNAGEVQVVGLAYNVSNVDRAFSWTAAGGMTDLGTLGGNSSRARDVNDAGAVTGTSRNASNNSHAFLWTPMGTNGVMTDLGTLGGSDSVGYAINNAGQVVGRSPVPARGDHAFVWKDGQMADLNNLIVPDSGWELQYATGINEAGQIAGRGSIDTATHAFLLTPVHAGDFDDDGDVDSADYAVFADCLAGPGVMPNPPLPTTTNGCLIFFDMDNDADVDAMDFAVFQQLFTAP